MAREKRMIDVNKVIASMQKCLDEAPDKKDTVAYFAFESIITALKQEPTVDAVEVVRCKYCDNTCHGTNGLVCIMWGAGTDPDGWCHKGERREGE